jgi:hypothetical protein
MQKEGAAVPAKLTILKRLLFLIAVMSALPACYADTGYYRTGYYAPAYRRPYYREGYYYRAPPPRTVVVVPRGHGHWEDRHYYRAPAARPRDHYRHHDERRRHY